MPTHLSPSVTAIGLGALLMGTPSAAIAQTQPVKLTITTADLITAVRSDSLTLTGSKLNGEVTAGGTPCGSATNGTVKPSACPGLSGLASSLVKLRDLSGNEVELTLGSSNVDALSAEFTPDPTARVIRLPTGAPTDGDDLLVLVSARPPATAKRDANAPQTFNLEDVKGREAPLAPCSTTTPCTVTVRLVGAKKEYGATLTTYPAVAGGEPAAAQTQPKTTRPPMFDSCAAAINAHKEDYTICYDLREGDVRQTDNISNQIILPNRSVRVVVLHKGDQAVTVAMSGARGTYEPGSDSPSVAASHGEGDSTTTRTTSLEFGPRKPGQPVDVSVSVAGKVLASTELEVATTYAGAVRLGVAAGTVIDATFEAITAPGSTQAEITQTSGADQTLEPELVVAYAPFWFQPKGRSYLGETAPASFERMAPFLGLGVASLSASSTVKFSLLHSVYVGMEYEFGRHSSIFVAGQARAVDRLPAGYEVGGPISGSEVPTVRDWPLGIAFGYTFSPDFLKVAQPLASE